MKTTLIFLCLGILSAAPAFSGTAEDKAFTDKYKTALEAKDATTLASFLYTQGADPGIVEFYKMMQSAQTDGKVSKIELVALTADEAKKAAAPQDSPTGGKVCLTLAPTKKLVVTAEAKDGESSSSGTSQSFIAEKDGKLVIPVPGPCK
jgi:hypothetical protein